jgi:hypothetical protein
MDDDGLEHLEDDDSFESLADDTAADNNVVFVYTEGAFVPENVVRARIDPSVRRIRQDAFAFRTKLEEVELHEDLREISGEVFSGCTALTVFQVPDRVEIIRNNAFECTGLIQFRIPPLVTTRFYDGWDFLDVIGIPEGMFNHCRRLFSVEVPKDIFKVSKMAFSRCYSLRNIALASFTKVEYDEDEGRRHAFWCCLDLLQIFNTVEGIEDALRNRFSGLTHSLHSMMYYKSYYPNALEEIRNIINMDENGELHPTGNQQDCLGMTPLHILACSTVHSLELYRLMIDKYPGNLIVEDAWGAVPLLYAVWGDAPSEVVQFLIVSYQSLYPDYEFDWTAMVMTLGRANAPVAVIQNLLDIQQSLSPRYIINWDRVLRLLAEPINRDESYFQPCASPKTFCFLTRCSIAKRVKAMGVKHFRDAMADDWSNDEESIYGDDDFNRQAWLNETLAKLEYYESEFRRLKETTSLLELAMWKARISSLAIDNEKMKLDLSDFRLQSRISCGADHAVEHVWPHLLPSDFVRSPLLHTLSPIRLRIARDLVQQASSQG